MKIYNDFNIVSCSTNEQISSPSKSLFFKK